MSAHLPVPRPRQQQRGASGDIRQRLTEWQTRERFYVWPFATQPIRSSVVQGTSDLFSHKATKVEMAEMSLEGTPVYSFRNQLHPLLILKIW